MSSVTEIDENLMSRVMYALGRETLQKMANSSILVIGLSGMGVEIAKNLILTGTKEVVLWDDHLVQIQDLSTNFYLKEADVNKTARAQACLEQLSELNRAVSVRVHSGQLSKDQLSKYTVVILTGYSSMDEALLFNKNCREVGTKFIMAEQNGVLGYTFVDCGSKHLIVDQNGEQPKSNLIASITPGMPTKITLNEDERLELEDTDLITFTEVKSDGKLTTMNDLPPQKIKVTGKSTLELPEFDTSDVESKWGTHELGSGYIHQFKQSVTKDYLSLEESLVKPNFMMTDFGKMDTAQLHLLMQSVHRFNKENENRAPTSSDQDVAEVLKFASEINDALLEDSPARVEEINKSLLTALTRVYSGQLQPLVAALGGLVAQEAIKACSGKFTPIDQWCYFDVRELYAKGEKTDNFDGMPSNEDLLPKGSRYDGLAAVVGWPLVEKLRASSTFLVGAGAVGCEIIKNFGMLGLATKDGATIHVTDMDSIEKSNLSRQFLYRDADIDQPKSTTAAKKVTDFNPDVNVVAYQERVGSDNEEVFNDDFFNKLAFVTNALDNIKARLYMDGKCVQYGKALLESGTLGSKGNTQVVVPHVTESYGASRDPPEKSIPACTLHHFPTKKEHVIQLTRDRSQ